MDNYSIAAVILAAGQSRRMGTPKMLLPWGEKSVLGQVVFTFYQAGVKEIIVVTGGSRDAVEIEISSLAHDYPVRSVFNDTYENGEMLLSLQTGLKSLDQGVTHALIGLGDQPQISENAIKSILVRAKTPQYQLVIPSHEMHRGHPWLLHRSLWDEVIGLSLPKTMHDFLDLHSHDIHYVDTDSTVLKDLDTQDDYARDKP